jgi:hypothetical protein
MTRTLPKVLNTQAVDEADDYTIPLWQMKLIRDPLDTLQRRFEHMPNGS